MLRFFEECNETTNILQVIKANNFEKSENYRERLRIILNRFESILCERRTYFKNLRQEALSLHIMKMKCR